MCGIAGFCHHKRDWQTNIERMMTRMKDRGPDSAGVWKTEDCDVVLGHTRLAIIDLSESGSQPMVSLDGRYCIILNGEIYNHQDLKNEQKGHPFKGTSDTEVLLEYAARFGIRKTLSKIKGMFAFCLYDNKKKIIYLARDRAGEKPLYYTMQDESFIFASHISALAEHDGVCTTIEKEVLTFYFTHKYMPAPWTIYKDVYMLEPGSLLIYDVRNKTLKKEKFWCLSDVVKEARIEEQQENLSYEDTVEMLDQVLNDAVSRQMAADVPVGVFLSGGIDSSLVTSLMQRQSSKKVKTFTIGFPGIGFDEAKDAKETARYLGTDHHELYVTQEQLLDVIPLIPGIYGEPFGDTSAISTYLVSKFAGNEVKVVLSGDGGDELFCGYDSYKNISKFWDLSRKVPVSVKALLRSFPQNKPKWVCAYKGRVLMEAMSISELYERLPYRNPLVNQIGIPFHTILPIYSDIERHGDVQDLMQMDFISYLPGDILTKVDRAAMSCSLETRVPLLDVDVIKYAMRVPVSYKWDGKTQKKILKAVLLKYLPKSLFERKKHGFEVPVQNWLKAGRLKEWSHDMMAYGRSACREYVNWGYADRLCQDFWANGRWDESIWYILMFLEWHRREYEGKRRGIG